MNRHDVRRTNLQRSIHYYTVAREKILRKTDSPVWTLYPYTAETGSWHGLPIIIAALDIWTFDVRRRL